MWDKAFLLLLSVEAAVASQCHQGPSFSEAVVSLMVDSSRIRRVPGVASLSQCVTACCDLPGYDLAWLFQGRCFILSCQRRDDCRPRRRSGSDSQLAFLRRTLDDGPLSPFSESPRDLEVLKDLILADGPQQDITNPGRLDVDYPWEEGGGREATTNQPSFSKRDNFNQSEAEDGLEEGLTGSRASSEGNSSPGVLGLRPDPAQRPVKDSSDQTDDRDSTWLLSALQKPATRSIQYAHIRTSPPTTATLRWPISMSVQPDTLKTSTAPSADRSLPPIAHASGSHIVSLPNSSLVLRGSVTQGDQNQIQYLWVRDNQSPAAGDVLYGSETQASLYLANLVEGTYLFQLRVTDAQGRSGAATATVEVRPEPGGGQEVELEMLVSVSQVSVAQRDMVVRQLAALLHVLDGDIQVRALQGHSHLSTVMRFSVWGPSGPISGSSVVGQLRNQLLREKSDYLLFRVLRVDTVLCLLRCSGHGQCDPITKQCTCDPFWTGNLIRRYLGDGESNCEWRVLYVILTSFIIMVFILSVSWTFFCCCRRTRVRKKTRYTILDNMDDQERMELRPKFSIKHRSTEHNSSLMMSESELDSDQDAIFSRGRPVRSRNRISTQAAANGSTFS